MKWTRKSLRRLSRELQRRGYRANPDTVRRLLAQCGYSQRVNRKRLTKKRDADRDAQMRYVARKRRAFMKAGWPVISIDAKKRELIGLFKQPGRTWRQQGVEVLEYDYPSQADGVAIPYGIYDLARNEALVVVGTSHQTPRFAGAAVRRWWMHRGRHIYGQRQQQRQLLIEADCGGANGNRCWLWKWELQNLADDFGLSITVTHLPTSASKWNPVEHRLFCHLSANWAGQPLVSYETILKYIRTTKTDKGLRCRAYLDSKFYQTGVKITAEQRSQLNLHPHRVLPKWNYTITPHEWRK